MAQIPEIHSRLGWLLDRWEEKRDFYCVWGDAMEELREAMRGDPWNTPGWQERNIGHNPVIGEEGG